MDTSTGILQNTPPDGVQWTIGVACALFQARHHIETSNCLLTAKQLEAAYVYLMMAVEEFGKIVGYFDINSKGTIKPEAWSKISQGSYFHNHTVKIKGTLSIIINLMESADAKFSIKSSTLTQEEIKNYLLNDGLASFLQKTKLNLLYTTPTGGIIACPPHFKEKIQPNLLTSSVVIFWGILEMILHLSRLFLGPLHDELQEYFSASSIAEARTRYERLTPKLERVFPAILKVAEEISFEATGTSISTLNENPEKVKAVAEHVKMEGWTTIRERILRETDCISYNLTSSASVTS